MKTRLTYRELIAYKLLRVQPTPPLPSLYNIGTNTVPVWSSQMPNPTAQELPNPNFYIPVSNNHTTSSSAKTQFSDDVFVQATNNGWSSYTPVFIHNGVPVSMPSPISANSFVRRNEMPPNPMYMGPSQMNYESNLPYMYSHSGGADITLTTSQIASRHVMTKDLPHFSGKHEEWLIFITNYFQSTERCGFTDQENQLRLQKCLKGPALEAVRGKLIVPNTVSSAIETLKMLYGCPDVIYQTMQRKLRLEAPVKPDKLESLIHLSLAVQNYCSTVQAIGLDGYLNDPVLLSDLVSKLPSDLKLDWSRHQMTLSRTDVKAFDNWLSTLATCASRVTTFKHPLPTSNNETKNASRQSMIMVHDVVEHSQESSLQLVSCPKCSSDHRLPDCDEFLLLDTQDRWKFIRAEGLCLRCFKKHFVRRCNSKRRCDVDGCSMSHHPLLHQSREKSYTRRSPTMTTEKQQEDKELTNEKPAARETPDRVVSFHSNEPRKAMFRYVPVKLFNGSKSIQTYAFVDEGSAITLMEEEIAMELGLDGPKEELCLRWTNDITQNDVNSKVLSLNISSFEQDAQSFTLNNVRTVSSLDLPVQSISSAFIMEHDHLRTLPILPYANAQAKILIGIDNAKIGMPLETREAEDSDVIATRCRIGWAVYGRERGSTPLKTQSVMHVCPCSFGSDEKMDEMLKAYFSLDSVGICSTLSTLASKEDERSQKIMKQSSTYFHSRKRWETGLLWRYNNIQFPNSLPMAQRRLQCLESKMKRDPELSKFLIETIKSYQEKGYVRKLKKNEIQSGGKAWYIPIFTVTNINKNKKRLVWDAAATVNDVSLNTNLMKGPDLLTSLVGVLIRFRERSIALCGDIKEMFHQILIRKEDQASQMFLWRDGDSSREPDIFVMQVMTFGASCSPSLANYIKNRNAIRWIKYTPSAVEAILRNTYVDDWLHSVDSEDEMIKMACTVKNIHREGGFEMRNWTSNSKRVLTSLTGLSSQNDKRIEEFSTTALHEKVLGLWWCPDTDKLTFFEKFPDVVFDEKTFPTKRQILRVVMKIFDPLGLLGFFVIHAKVILQNIWRSGVSWDEPVRSEELEQWWQWVQLITSIKLIQIPRCYPLVSSSENVELHLFVDASIDAYAAVAYLRAEKLGQIACSFVASKTRVAPLKPISIPRLELMAAILGLRLAKFISNEMSIPIKRRFFWTDSRNVLHWIRSDARKFHQFVAVRIGEILEGSEVNEWRWVSTAHNVADEGTKWSKSLQFDFQSHWFSGPSFLRMSEDNWPETETSNSPAFESEVICHVNSINETSLKLCTIVPDPERFSKWERLRGAQRYILHFLKLVANKSAVSERVQTIIKTQGIPGAEFILFRFCQEDAFSNELTSLRSNTSRVSSNSSIFRSSPYLDENGLLRVRGRVDMIQEVPMDAKRPIILPQNHKVTWLLVDFYHRKFHHHHSEIVVNEVRQRFSISGLRALVSKVTKKCQLCKNRRALPTPPSMGSLPPERLAPFTQPFTYTGVDYFGPMDIAVGRRREKRWGVLFTCLTTRAVHLEISSSLSTESFLLVLKQFISRRGVPKRIMSDNGTNFRGASRILVEEIEKVSSNQLEQRYPEIEWSFIPPASPHMGGVWERMIRSVKSILVDVLRENSLREEVLRATLADIENILNSRPLTYVPLDSPMDEALTPNHFLVGSSSGIRELSDDDSSGSSLRRNFNLSNQLANQFWKRWVREYLP